MRKAQNEPQGSSRSKKKELYRRLQREILHNESDAMQRIVKGQWQNNQSHLISEVLSNFWVNVFGRPSDEDSRPYPHVPEQPFSPITAEEVEAQQKLMRVNTAADTDGESVRAVKALSPVALAIEFNVILGLAIVPDAWKQNRTTLLPKVEQPTTAAQYRPITAGQARKRLMHRVLLGK